MRLENFSISTETLNLLCELIIFVQQSLFLSIFQYSDKIRNSLTNRHVEDQNECVIRLTYEMIGK